jgi:glycosyltransferase involved in cell wall biosynthesis
LAPKISIFIISKNEARIIEETLKQASKLADEIIIVDSGSTDDTIKIAQQYTKQIYFQNWLGYGAQKNYALSLCNNNWVLSLDADEVLSDELIKEIKNLNFNKDAYQIARKFFIGDRFVRFGGYYPDYQLRLFQKSIGRFCDSPVHESVEMLSENGLYSKDRKAYPCLRHAVNHYAYDSLESMERSFLHYATLDQSPKRSFTMALCSYIYVFLYRFIIRLGILEGLLGLGLTQIHAYYSFKKKINGAKPNANP